MDSVVADEGRALVYVIRQMGRLESMLSKFVESLTLFYREMILPAANVIWTRFPAEYL